MPPADRTAATDLLERMKNNRIDPAKQDEGGRPAGDRPPGFADALMSEPTVVAQRDAELSSADWDLIERSLEHYGSCASA